MSSLCGFFLQSAHEDDKPAKIADYANPTLAECQAIHDYAYEAYLTVSMLLRLYRSIYGKLIKDLLKSYSMGTNQYSKTRAKMQDTIFHCRNRASCYVLCAPPGAVIFVQDNNDNMVNVKTHTSDCQRDPWELIKVKYLRCQEFGHFTNMCPNGANIGKTHANVSTEEKSKNNVSVLISTLDIDDDADYLFEGFANVTNGSNKSHLEAALTTPTQADRSVTNGRSAKVFHNHNRSIPLPYILLYNHCTVNVFCNPTLLQNICASNQTLHLSYNADTVLINQVGDLSGYGRVWCHPKGISNILGMSNIADNEKY